MMESEVEFEKILLVEADDNREASPPMSPVIGQVLATPPSPTSNKVSSSGGGSFSSRTINKFSMAPNLTPVPGGANSRFLCVNSKLNNLSRRPSVLSDNSSRTPKELSVNVKMTNMKRDGIMKLDPAPVFAPPNTPTPMECRNTASEIEVESHSETWQCGSASSSRLTTKAVASDSDTVPEEKGSSETLKTSSFTGNQVDAFSYLRARMGQVNARSVGSNAYMKSLRAQQRPNHRNIQHHSFFTDTTDVRQMEHALLQLLEDFHSGKLRAFGKDVSMEQMQGIREQQERLARLHFDLGARQELYAPLSDEGLRANQDNMHHLMSSLQKLSQSIEKLQLFSKNNNAKS